MRFVLVHGAYHGAWCWDLVVTELRKLGHTVLAPDLPIEVPGSGADVYADEVAAAIGDEEAVVVGHSMMGLAIPLVAQRAPVSRLVFLCAFVPQPGSSFNEVRKREEVEPNRKLQHSQFTDLGDGVWMIGPDAATELFYHDASPVLASWAVPLLRPQSYRIMQETTPLAEWPPVKCEYILCRADRAVDADWARSTARDGMGILAHEIDGGHSPFLTRPAELARLLVGIAEVT